MRFDIFNSQAFERLVQAISVHVFGPGVVIFGNGPDGAREASFEGNFSVPREGSFSGYLVVQAKCKDVPAGDARDAKWLAKQLRADLTKFVKNDDLRRPHFYLIATNVHLSAVPKTGGKALVEHIFEEFAPQIGLRRWFIWGADELTAILDGADDIRRSYTAWLTPSDVLASLIEQFGGPALKRLLPLALARDLRQERDVRLRDAGQETEKPIYLEDVFFDLPVTGAEPSWTSEDAEPMEMLTISSIIEEEDEATEDGMTEFDISEDDEVRTERCVGLLLKRSAEKLDPESLSAARQIRQHQPYRNRIVILGGPGQGKSTLGQFLAQIARAKLLKEGGLSALSPATSDAVDRILTLAGADALPILGPCRFPVRIDLPIYADALASATRSGKYLGILSHIANRLTRDLEVSISVDSLRTWLVAYPWLIIFDGLDEVPPSSNRTPVIEAIDGFMDEVYAGGSDVLVVITSRPQGYHHDLDPKYWEHWELQQLAPSDAIKFAGMLAAVRISDKERQAAIVDDVTRACLDPATQLLTTSPLQVTILFGISFLKGSIPQDRWELFDRYYMLLRDREAQKPGSTGSFVRDHKRTIDAIHQTVGWILQVAAEGSGRSSAFLTEVQFRELIQTLLIGEGFDETEAETFSHDFARVATDRLVLLSTQVEGRVAFDVRSLQEYMAAAKLAGSGPTEIDRRLRTISLSAHWRHVFRIAASKLFSTAELGHLRNTIIAICDALDHGDIDDAARTVRMGAALALDLFVDGVGSGAPLYRRRLAKRALQRLDLGLEGNDLRLRNVAVPETIEVVKNETLSRLAQGNTLSARAAWRLLFSLENSQPWAREIVLQEWPSKPDFALQIASETDARLWSPALQEKIVATQFLADPLAVLDFAVALYQGQPTSRSEKPRSLDSHVRLACGGAPRLFENQANFSDGSPKFRRTRAPAQRSA